MHRVVQHWKPLPQSPSALHWPHCSRDSMAPGKGSTAADCAVLDMRARASEMVEKKCMIVVLWLFGCLLSEYSNVMMRARA